VTARAIPSTWDSPVSVRTGHRLLEGIESVLADAGQPLHSKQITKALLDGGLWQWAWRYALPSRPSARQQNVQRPVV